MKQISILLFLLFGLLTTQCSWFKKDKDDLPAPTQEGKNMFGCKVNGEVWRPSGNNGTLNKEASYDYDPEFGWFVNIRASRRKNKAPYQSIGFYINNVAAPGEYVLDSINKRAGRFIDFETNCIYDREVDYMRGKAIITKLDQVNRIVAGTFEFTVAMPGCDTIRVTDGRFDLLF